MYKSFYKDNFISILATITSKRFLQVPLFLFIFFLALFVNRAAAGYQVTLDPSSGYAESSIEVTIKVKSDELNLADAIQFNIVTNSNVKIAGYKEVDAPCQIDLFQKNSATTLVCLSNSDKKISGEFSLVTLILESEAVGEGEIFIRNLETEFETVPFVTSGGYRFEAVKVFSNSEEESEHFFDLDSISNWWDRNKRVTIFIFVAIFVVTIILILFFRKGKTPVQFRLLSTALLLLTTLTLMVSNFTLLEKNLDPSSNAGEENQLTPINNLPSVGADLNGDNVIDDIDFQIFRYDFKTWVEDGKYFRRSDFNTDKKIDVKDYTLMKELAGNDE